MRNEDKALLLAETLGVDTSIYIPKYIDELRSSDIFITLCENVAKARESNSYRAQKLIDDFESIDFSAITTMKDYLILVAKINYLLSTSEDKDYLNPFFYDEEKNEIYEIGNISIIFDQKDLTINDMILDERYTTTYKIDFMKHKYLEWRKEVVDKIIDPMKMLMVKKENIPNLSYIDSSFFIYFTIVFLINATFILSPMIKSGFLTSLYTCSCKMQIAQYLFYAIAITIVYIDAVTIIRFNSLRRKYDSYIYSKGLLRKTNRIINNIDRQCEKFYRYILKGVNDHKPLDKHISSFSINRDYLRGISTLFKITSEEAPSNSQKSMYTSFGVIGLVLLVLLFIAQVISYFIFKGGF